MKGISAPYHYLILSYSEMSSCNAGYSHFWHSTRVLLRLVFWLFLCIYTALLWRRRSRRLIQEEVHMYKKMHDIQ